MKEKHRQIIEALIRSTEDGKTVWNATARDNKYQTHVKDYIISIYAIKDEGAYSILLPGTVCAQMDFIDHNGDVFDKIIEFSNKSDDFRKLSQLHEKAHGSATGADQKLTDILSAL